MNSLPLSAFRVLLVLLASPPGKPPTYREIAKRLGWKVWGHVSVCLRRLEREGLIEREKGSWRAIKVKCRVELWR